MNGDGGGGSRRYVRVGGGWIPYAEFEQRKRRSSAIMAGGFFDAASGTGAGAGGAGSDEQERGGRSRSLSRETPRGRSFSVGREAAMAAAARGSGASGQERPGAKKPSMRTAALAARTVTRASRVSDHESARPAELPPLKPRGGGGGVGS
jgi:hypothetical protein